MNNDIFEKKTGMNNVQNTNNHQVFKLEKCINKLKN